MNIELTVEAVRASDGLTTIPYPFALRQLVSGIVPADGHRGSLRKLAHPKFDFVHC